MRFERWTSLVAALFLVHSSLMWARTCHDTLKLALSFEEAAQTRNEMVAYNPFLFWLLPISGTCTYLEYRKLENIRKSLALIEQAELHTSGAEPGPVLAETYLHLRKDRVSVSRYATIQDLAHSIAQANRDGSLCRGSFKSFKGILRILNAPVESEKS